MQLISDWNTLRDNAHNTAVRHGFWDDEPSDDHFLCLISSELMEAVNADRKSNNGNLQAMVAIVDQQAASEYGITDDWMSFWFKTYFEERVKDSVGDEIADAIIRILDLAGKHNINLGGIMLTESRISKDKRFTENIRTIEKYLCHDGFSLDEKLNYAKQEICTFAELLGIDIITHINLKMMYNKTRIVKHGKKY